MEESDLGSSSFGAFLDSFLWLLGQFGFTFLHVASAVSNPSLWLDWSDKQAIMRFVYYGASVELLFVVITTILIVFLIGIWNRSFLWNVVRGLEGFANITGRFFAWAGLLMVIQQIIIIFMQRIFVRPDITIGLGIPLQFDISWFAEELKLYNAIVISLCCTYTFVQSGHVRVDLIYSGVKFKTKKMIDMMGCLFFMAPMAIVIWLYGWFFLWRHLIVPKPSASDTLDRLLAKSRALRWNVETIGFSPNGFNGYFLFKVLLCAFAAMIFIHAVAFFFRSFCEWREGEKSEKKFLDEDSLDEDIPAQVGQH